MQSLPVDPVDAQALEQVNDALGFPNSLLVEFWLLLQRSWKQQGRDRGSQVRSGRGWR